VIVTFCGHATFDVTLPDGRRLCLDPYQAGGFGGLVALPPLPDHFDLALCSHEHGDHNAVEAIPAARRIAAPFADNTLRIDGVVAPHDEHGGRLRGGLVTLHRISAGGVTLVHCGDLGERPAGALLDWLRERPIDLLLAPAGGHFTLGPDAFCELVALTQPALSMPCHTADDGTRFAELAPVAWVERRFARVDRGGSLHLSPGAHRLDGQPVDGPLVRLRHG
jgi:L-ascorbate metabolism protein UlaG (beta-lactamase superfamily)